MTEQQFSPLAERYMDTVYRQMNEECAAYLSHITITDIETQLFAHK